MTPEEVRAAVAQVGGRAELEASGGVTLETLLSTRPKGARMGLDGRAHAFRARPGPVPAPGGVPVTLLSLDNIPA